MSNVGKQFHYDADRKYPRTVYTVLWEDDKGVLMEFVQLAGNGRNYYSKHVFETYFVAIPVNEYTLLYRASYDTHWSVCNTLGDVSEFKAAEKLADARKANPVHLFKLVKTV